MHDIPSLADLESRFAREQAIGRALVGLLLVADLAMVWRLFAQGTPHFLFLSVLLLGASAGLHLAGFVPLFQSRKRSATQLGLSDIIGRYSSGQIQRMIAEVMRPHRAGEVPTIYITEPKHDGAYAINSLFFNFLRPLNAVYASRHLFRILRPAEIKAILAHELGHFHRYLEPVSRARSALMVFNALLPLQLFDPRRPVSAGLAALCWLLVSALVIRSLNAWALRHSRLHEHLSDLHAARLFGVINIVNGLLGICRTAEIQLMLHRELLGAIRADETLSIEDLPGLFEQIDGTLPDRPLQAGEIQAAVTSALGSPAGRSLRKRLSAARRREEVRQVEVIIERFMLNRTFALFDWSEFDTAVPDGRIDGAEYPQLIRLLEAHPGRQLFNLGTDHRETAAASTHPTVRERILFLEKCRRTDPGIPLLEPAPA